MKIDRDLVLKKSGGKCWYCGSELNGRWQADHFHPVIRANGKPLYPELDSIENLVPSCAPCNNFKSSSNIEGFRLRVAEQFDNSLKRSQGLRQLNRLGLIEISRKPVIFWFESQGLAVLEEQHFFGISDEAKDVIWNYDSVEECHYAEVGNHIVTARESGIGLKVIATTADWEQERTELSGNRYLFERAAEWAIRLSG